MATVTATPGPADPSALLAQAIQTLEVEIANLSADRGGDAEEASKRLARAVNSLRILIREARDIAKASSSAATGASDEELALYLIDSPVGFAIFQKALATRNMHIAALDEKKLPAARLPEAKKKQTKLSDKDLETPIDNLDEF